MVPTFKMPRLWSILRHVFASLRHHEALWGVPLEGQREQSVVFLREETAFTLQNEQNKLDLKSGAHRAAKGMAQSAVSPGPIKHAPLATGK